MNNRSCSRLIGAGGEVDAKKDGKVKVAMSFEGIISFIQDPAKFGIMH